MSGVNFNFNNSNAISGFDNPAAKLSPKNELALQNDSSGKAGWGHDTFPGMDKFPASAREQLQSMSKELATAYEDVMARIDQSTKDGAPSHVLDNLKRVASDILAGAKELLDTISSGPGNPAAEAIDRHLGSDEPSKLDTAMATAQTIMDGIRSNMDELVKITKDPGIYFPDVSESGTPETNEEISADVKSPDVPSGEEFNAELGREAAMAPTRSLDAARNRDLKELKGPELNARAKEAGGTNKASRSESTDAKGEVGGTEESNKADTKLTQDAAVKELSSMSGQELYDLMKSDPERFTELMTAAGPQGGFAAQTALQEHMQAMNRMFSALSNIMNAEHQTGKAIIQNFRV